MRVYHFVCEEFGLEDIERRRLKIARVGELNDPFDWHSVHWPNQQYRAAHQSMIDEMAEKTGILCFSRDWHNPVQWSHYADRHKGICLGFDIPDTWLQPVKYRNRRLIPDILRLIFHQEHSEEFVRDSLITKFSHWRYEQEVRAFIRLDHLAAKNGFYFYDFCNELRLQEVIIGAKSDLTRTRLLVALDNLAPDVRCRKARLAVKTFRIVEQRKASLWI